VRSAAKGRSPLTLRSTRNLTRLGYDEVPAARFVRCVGLILITSHVTAAESAITPTTKRARPISPRTVYTSVLD
jgi:hypothetical protein